MSTHFCMIAGRFDSGAVELTGRETLDRVVRRVDCASIHCAGNNRFASNSTFALMTFGQVNFNTLSASA